MIKKFFARKLRSLIWKNCFIKVKVHDYTQTRMETHTHTYRHKKTHFIDY